MEPLLSVGNLTAGFKSSDGWLSAIKGIDLDIEAGETVCLVGESGSGKTVASLAIMRLLEYGNGKITGGDIELDGLNLTKLSQRELRDIRGRKVAMVFQEPMTALDSIFTIGYQITEAIVRHKRVSTAEANRQAVELLRKVGIADPEARVKQYPFQLSGGMLQRVMIALALSCEPDLLIADEPTTALDVTIQAQILDLLRSLKEEFNMSLLLITHDLGIAAEMADRVAVMYAGKIVELAPVKQLFTKPLHPYTKGLLQVVSSLDSGRDETLYAIPGSIPPLSGTPSGCSFHPRCTYATDRCIMEMPALREVEGVEVACLLAEDIAGLSARSTPAEPVEPALLEEERLVAISSLNEEKRQEASLPLVVIDSLTKHFPIRAGRLFGKKGFIHAVDDVSFHIHAGETFGLVGESGSGKSTLGRLAIRLEKATSGSVKFEGTDLMSLNGTDLRLARRNMQIVFQDPYSSVDPRWRIGEIIGEPLLVHGKASAKERREIVQSILRQVGLPADAYDRFPHQFSGGQRQRIGIARAIMLNPKFIVADEAVSSLDVSMQSQVVNLLQSLQADLGLTYLFISHGLHLVRHISDRIGVMYLGKLVEIAPADELFLRPAHHYTKALIGAVPSVDLTKARKGHSLEGEIPSPTNLPGGCRFHTRCPAVTDRCKAEPPALREVAVGHWAACHYPS